MTHHARSFGNFSIFFSTSFLLFWPYALVVIGSSLAVALFLTWQGDFLANAFAFWDGSLQISNDISLVFLMPAALLFGLPLWFLWGGGSLFADQFLLLSSLTQLMTTPYGFIGVLLTTGIAAGLITWSMWCAKRMLDLSWEKAFLYLASLAFIMSALFYVW